MADRVIKKLEIELNSYLYPITRPVQSTLASIYPSKIVVGDTNRDSNPTTSVLALSDQRGGIGVEVMDGEAQVDRAFYSTANLRYKNHLILPPLATATAASGISAIIHIPVIIEYGDEIYAVFGSDVRKYNDVTDSWGDQLHDLPAGASDALVVRLGATVYLVFAHTNGYTYFDGTTWTDDTEDVKYLVAWDGKLYGIDHTGQLRYSSSIGSWTDDAQLPLPSGVVTDLLLGRDSGGATIIYAMTTSGLYAHDGDLQKFIETEVGLPTHPRNGLRSVKWRDSMYITAGLGIYKYATGSARAVLSVVGPDRDDGLPNNRQGDIQFLVGSHNSLIAGINSSTPDSLSSGELSNSVPYVQRLGFRSQVVVPPTGRSMLLDWNESGWMVLWESADSTHALTQGAFVSSAYGKYRIWWAHNQVVNYIDLPSNIVNARQVSSYKFASAFTHDYPHFTAGQSEVTKVAVRLKAETKGVTSDETFTISYAINYSTSFTAFAAITSDGTTTFDFPNSSTPTGTTFRAIQFRVVAARGSTNTLTPDLIALTLEFYKKMDAKWLHGVEVDLSKPYNGQTVQQKRANLITAIESGTLVHYAHRDPDANSNAEFYVRIQSATSMESTGYDESGVTRLQLVEA